MPNYFKLDSNIDLSYTDNEGNEKIVKDAIQVVSGTDGSSTITDSRGLVEDYTLVDDITETTSISGRGILFDNIGDILAKKGNLLFRDTSGNVLTLDSIKYNNIKEDSINNTYFRDKSLDSVTNGTKDYVSVNQLLKTAQESVLAPGNGNIVQATNKKEIDSDLLELLTVPLSDSNIVSVKCKINMTQDAYITLTDTTISGGEVVLSDVEIKTDRLSCAYLNYTGTLEYLQDSFEYDTSNTAIYNSFYKRFFTNSRIVGDSYEKDAPHKLTLKSSSPFSVAYMNIIVSDNKRKDTVKNGTIILNNQDRHVLRFDEDFEDNEYVISSLETSEAISVWWVDKKSSGFTINLDRNFTGSIYWEVVR
jgi:hypothetical protein